MLPRRATEPAWLTPIPSTKRPGYASVSIRQPFAIAVGSRAQMFAIPDTASTRSVLARIHDAWAKTSRLSTDSGSQIAR